MLLVARGKVTSLTSGDINMCNFSWISSRVLLEQAWREMAQTLTEANFGFISSCALDITADFVEEYFAVSTLKGGACCHQNSELVAINVVFS
ncbi:uncharacterized protein HKW66_Vig0224320 [Vigna angularis]|uniref:Uncharacterized protein n=1 Tax=Phaseolus angularis TaxID=3914 RepID=A0A8T0K1W5_PHAAN|nr:uncharacterized protein HKW66_Vig0224320 [Vigna angularis]